MLKAKEFLRKYQKENSSLKKVNMQFRTGISFEGHALLSLSSLLF